MKITSVWSQKAGPSMAPTKTFSFSPDLMARVNKILAEAKEQRLERDNYNVVALSRYRRSV